MKFSGYLPLHEDTSAIDFTPSRSIRLVGHGPKVGHNVLDFASEYKWDKFSVLSVFNLFDNLVAWCSRNETDVQKRDSR